MSEEEAKPTEEVPETEAAPAHTVAEIRAKFAPLLVLLSPEHRALFEELCDRAVIAENVTVAFVEFQTSMVTSFEKARASIDPSRVPAAEHSAPTPPPIAPKTQGDAAKVTGLDKLVIEALRRTGPAQRSALIEALGNVDGSALRRSLNRLRELGRVRMEGVRGNAFYELVPQA